MSTVGHNLQVDPARETTVFASLLSPIVYPLSLSGLLSRLLILCLSLSFHLFFFFGLGQVG